MKKFSALLVIICILSCEKSDPPPHPGANLIGNYQLNCTCDDIGTPTVENTPKSYQMSIVEIANDTANLEVQNVDNAGISFIVDLLTANSFECTTDYMEGSLYQSALTLSYVRNPNNCDCTGTKQ